MPKHFLKPNNDQWPFYYRASTQWIDRAFHRDRTVLKAGLFNIWTGIRIQPLSPFVVCCCKLNNTWICDEHKNGQNTQHICYCLKKILAGPNILKNISTGPSAQKVGNPCITVPYQCPKRDSIHSQKMTLLMKQTLYQTSHHGWILNSKHICFG